jgi:hypothetical protein
MTTALAKFESPLNPKPTRTEILEALTRVKISELNAEIEAMQVALNVKKSKVEKLLHGYVYQNLCELEAEVFYGHRWEDKSSRGYILKGAHIDFMLTADKLPPELMDKMAEICDESAKIPCTPRYNSIRELIKKAIDKASGNSDRVETLINNPDSLKVLKDTLAALEK